MKVGLYFRGFEEELGGVYTFQHELMNALIEMVDQTYHEFSIIGWGKEIPNCLKIPSKIKYLSLHRGLMERMRSKTVRSFSEALHLLNINKGKYRRWNINNHILRVLINNGIGMTWSTATSCLTTDLPYIVTVFDLQHRLQPYFPEVSSQGEWESREKQLSKILKRAAFIVTGTETGKAEIEQFYNVNSSRIKIIPFPAPCIKSDNQEESPIKIIKKYANSIIFKNT